MTWGDQSVLSILLTIGTNWSDKIQHQQLHWDHSKKFFGLGMSQELGRETSPASKSSETELDQGHVGQLGPMLPQAVISFDSYRE